ncbi:hypothetical protein AwPolaro_09410 [Polaromonas sp.]|nr:hypothetical protein AwPolaro_09410 [Polaromonas sp.]
MELIDMTDAPPGARQARLTYHDSSARAVFCTDAEVPFPDGRLIVSRADLKGDITHANEAFVEMSGYTLEDLIGAPQHILRHPDMPKAVFKGLWETVGRGEKWHGYVKNLRKDGKHYWVYATIVPNVRAAVVTGYTAVRRKPSRTRVAEAEVLYAQWLKLEGTPA